jgi:hypothetical protein
MKPEHQCYALDFHQQPFASHQPALIAATEATGGDVLELGMGRYSTGLLRHLLQGTGRKLVSMESDARWLAKFRHLRCDWHEVIHVPDWMQAVEEARERTWGVVFVDQHPQVMRHYAVLRLMDAAEILVVHDADHMRQLKGGPWRCREYFPVLKAHAKRRGPPTLLLSRQRNVAEIPIGWE